MGGRLIVFEGTDGSGKATQSKLVCQELDRRGIPYKKLEFPRYGEESSALIRLYLSGAFGSKPEDVNAFAAATFFSVDRYASYKQDWGEFYEQGGLVIADRYTTSNAVHQTSKLPVAEREEFLTWLSEFEYERMGLPAPDLVIFLDMPTEKAVEMLRQREENTNTKADIHEQDMQYLATCRETGRAAAEYYGWTVIQCVKDGAMRSIEDIHNEIYQLVQSCLED